MNERIRTLADQAGLKYYNWITNESNVVDCDFRYPRAEDLQKFAQLIVKECADIATMNSHQWEPPGHYVRKHFGVE